MRRITIVLFLLVLKTGAFAQSTENKICGYYETYQYATGKNTTQCMHLTLTKDSIKLIGEFIISNHSWDSSNYHKKGYYFVKSDTIIVYDDKGQPFARFLANHVDDDLLVIKFFDSKLKMPVDGSKLKLKRDAEIYPDGTLKFQKIAEITSRATGEVIQYSYTNFYRNGHPSCTGRVRQGMNVGVYDTCFPVVIRPCTICAGSKVNGTWKFSNDNQPDTIYHTFRMGHWRNGRRVGIWKFYTFTGYSRGKPFFGSFYTLTDYTIRKEKYSYRRGLLWSKTYQRKD